LSKDENQRKYVKEDGYNTKVISLWDWGKTRKPY